MSTETMTLAEHLAKFEAETNWIPKLRLGNSLRERIRQITIETMNGSPHRNRLRVVTNEAGESFLRFPGEKTPPPMK